jgi:hypothetical protein
VCNKSPLNDKKEHHKKGVFKEPIGFPEGDKFSPFLDSSSFLKFREK